MKNSSGTITLTWGDVCENHIGNKQIGTKRKNGFSLEELQNAKCNFDKLGCETKLYQLNGLLLNKTDEELIVTNKSKKKIPLIRCKFCKKGFLKPEKVQDHVIQCEYDGGLCEKFGKEKLQNFNRKYQELHSEKAYLLVVRNGVDKLLETLSSDSNKLFKKLCSLYWDRKFWCQRRKRVLNKNARANMCISDKACKANYEKGQGTVYSFSELKEINQIRSELSKLISEKAKQMQCEGNWYFDVSKCGIGLHGDTERYLVVGMRFGGTMNLCFQGFYQSKSIGRMFEINLNSGDLYIMSEKATGNDWKKRGKVTFRHCCGGKKWMEQVRKRMK